MFQVIHESSLVDVLSLLLEPPLALVFLAFELSLVGLALIRRGVHALDQFVILESPLVGRAIEGEDTFSICMILHPLTFISGTIAPGKLPFPVLHPFINLALISLPVLIGDLGRSFPCIFYLREILVLLGKELEGFVAGVGETDGLPAGLGRALFLWAESLEGLAFIAQRTIAHLLLYPYILSCAESYLRVEGDWGKVLRSKKGHRPDAGGRNDRTGCGWDKAIPKGEVGKRRRQSDYAKNQNLKAR